MTKKIIFLLLLSFTTSTFAADDGIKYVTLIITGKVDRIQDYGSYSRAYEQSITYCSNPIKLDTNLYSIENAKLAFQYLTRRKFKSLGEVDFITQADSRSALRRVMLDEHTKYTKKGFPKISVSSSYIRRAKEGKLKF